MNIFETQLPGVVVFEPEQYRDERGYFMEAWHQKQYAEAGIPERFVQDNISWSKGGVLRGLHYQHPNPQGKLVSVLMGRVFDVAVDIRQGAPTFGTWIGKELSAENGWRLYVPEGYAHGFAVLDGPALVHYKCTAYYAPGCEHTLRWDDPTLAIDWPVTRPVLSEKDAAGRFLDALSDEALPHSKSM